MRKLRRLPWRIPKSHNHQPQSSAPEDIPARPQPEREPAARDLVNSQPVAFAGGRYVYGMAASVQCSTEIRRKTRHRAIAPLALSAVR